MRAPDDLLTRLRPSFHHHGLSVDLGGLDWVTPTVIVAVAAQAQLAAAHGVPFRVHAPRGRDPARYAARMRLGRMLTAAGAAHDLPDVAEHDQSEHLVELARIETEGDAARLARLVDRKVRPHDPELARALHGSIGEVGANVPDHAITVGFMAAQTMRRRRTLVVAVADAGPGLLATLAAAGAADHEQAIEYATTPAVSQFADPSRGTGLPTTLRLIAGVGGSVYIASGDRSIRHHAHTRRFGAVHGGDYVYPGTIVEVRIPLDRRPAATPERVHNEGHRRAVPTEGEPA
jgi:hypothetical protein